MGLIDFIFRPRKIKQLMEYFKLLNGYSPVFTSFSGGVYEMDLTRAVIERFAEHCSKLKPEMTGSAKRHLEKTLQFKPNPFMDTAKFISRIATYLECDHNAFIVPIEDKQGNLCGWYPILPEICEILDDGGMQYLRYTFGNGQQAIVELKKVGILTTHQYKNDFFGEGNDTIKPTMQLIHTSNEAIINAVKQSADIRFVAKIGNILKDKEIREERDRFAEENLSSENKSGLIVYDNKFENLKQVISKPYTPDANQMKQIQENVFNHFGSNMRILQNNFNEDEWNAYYEGKIEPFALQLSLVMSNMSYSGKEIHENNSITFSANRMQCASNKTKLEVSTQLFDRGLLNRNGVMDIWNLPHVENGEKYFIRKEYAEITEIGKEGKLKEEPVEAGKGEEKCQE